MRRTGIAALSIALIVFASPLMSGDAEDMLCGNAPKGSVEPLPELVTDYVVVLCTPTGQALAPAVKDKVVLWVTTKTGAAWMLEAVPRDFKRPASLSKYDLRFTRFAAVERTGEGLQRTLKMWDLAFAPTPRPPIDRVVQLDARSAWGGTIFSLFFYVSQSKPRWLVACTDQCKGSISLRVEEK
jgi:hypothetical protein